MACPTMTFNGVTPDVWTCLRQRASSLGVTLPPGNSGTVSHLDATLDYAWDPTAQTLSITITHLPPFIIECDGAMSYVRQAATACGAH